MSANLGTRIIDGDGHIMEDNAGIIAHMEGAYREIAGRPRRSTSQNCQSRPLRPKRATKRGHGARRQRATSLGSTAASMAPARDAMG